MANVEPGKAKAAGIVGILLLCFGLAIVICGFVWISYGGGDGTGLWSGIGVRDINLSTSLFNLISVFFSVVKRLFTFSMQKTNTINASVNRIYLSFYLKENMKLVNVITKISCFSNKWELQTKLKCNHVQLI
mgnify:CR=1